MKWGAIHFLNLLALVPALVIFYVYVFQVKKRLRLRFADSAGAERLFPRPLRTRQKVRSGLIVCACAFLVVAIARPQFGATLGIEKRRGIDIIVAIDVSDSMLTEDVKPTRLAAAKREVSGLIKKLKGDRIGIVLFAGESFVQCPLTLDYEACSMFVQQIDAGYIPVGGTSVAKAVQAARDAFIKKERKHKVFILMTDGESHTGDAINEAEEAKREGIKIYTIGIGTPSGEPIPIRDEAGNVIGHKKDADGTPVVSKLDEYTLQKIALTTNGKYYRSTAGQLELDSIYDDISSMEKKELSDRVYTRYEERFKIPLILSWLLLAIEMCGVPKVSLRKKGAVS
ncbi:MAG: VWA domain-containing protein [Candidatus Omnitrophica bacterium]|nr:VWA domain-containing protein [Candidatus Omnitrophota bacterium]